MFLHVVLHVVLVVFCKTNTVALAPICLMKKKIPSAPSFPSFGSYVSVAFDNNGCPICYGDDEQPCEEMREKQRKL